MLTLKGRNMILVSCCCQLILVQAYNISSLRNDLGVWKRGKDELIKNLYAKMQRIDQNSSSDFSNIAKMQESFAN